MGDDDVTLKGMGRNAIPCLVLAKSKKEKMNKKMLRTCVVGFNIEIDLHAAPLLGGRKKGKKYIETRSVVGWHK